MIRRHRAAQPVEEESPSTSDSALRRKIGMVASASAVAMLVGELITLVQTIVLARLLSPTEVGIFAAGTILTTFLNTFVEGGLRAGLVHRETGIADAAETVFRVTFISGLLLSLGSLAAAPLIGMMFDNRTAGLVAAATSGSLFLYALTNVPEAMLQRGFSVKRRVLVGPSVSLTFAVVAIGFASAGFGVWSLVIGSYASSVVWVALLWWITDWRIGNGKYSYRMWRELAGYGLPLLVGGIAERVKTMIESVIVGRALSEAALGHYRYAERIAGIPERAIVEVGAIALFPAFSRIAGDPERMRAAFLRALRWAMVGAAALTGMMLVLGEVSVVIVFGEPWREAGVVVVAMAGVGIGKAVTSVSYEAVKGAGRTSLLNWSTATEIGFGLGLMIALIGPLGLLGVGLAVSATSLVLATVSASLAISAVGVRLRQVVGAIGPMIPAAAVACLATGALEHFVFHSDSRSLPVGLSLLVADVLVYGIVYVAALAVFAPRMVRQLISVAGRLLTRFVVRPDRARS